MLQERAERWLSRRTRRNGWNSTDRVTCCGGGTSWTTPDAARLEAEIAAIDLEQLDRLIAEHVHGESTATVPTDRVEPVEVVRLPETDGERVARRRAMELGEQALAGGEVAVVLVAGGSGTRLGFDGPKGTFPIGPVSAASLFQIHAEKLVALGRRYGKQPPLYVMTSPDNHDATVRFFDQHDRFGLDRPRFFQQGQMPAVDRRTGKILLAEPDHLALSPDGHGGTLLALAAPGLDGGPSCLDEMRERGVRTLFYFQVDNPMVEIADPAYLGLHRQADAEMSFKVIEKRSPDEKVGVVVTVDGRPQVIEYSDLPPELAGKRRSRRPARDLGRQHRDPRARTLVHRTPGRQAPTAVPPGRQEGRRTSTTPAERSNRPNRTP